MGLRLKSLQNSLKFAIFILKTKSLFIKSINYNSLINC